MKRFWLHFSCVIFLVFLTGAVDWYGAQNTWNDKPSWWEVPLDGDIRSILVALKSAQETGDSVETAKLIHQLLTMPEKYYINKKGVLLSSYQAGYGALFMGNNENVIDSYLLQFSAEANSAFKKVLDTRDWVELTNIARKYPKTEAGNLALLNLLQYHIHTFRIDIAEYYGHQLLESNASQEVKRAARIMLAKMHASLGEGDKLNTVLAPLEGSEFLLEGGDRKGRLEDVKAYLSPPFEIVDRPTSMSEEYFWLSLERIMNLPIPEQPPALQTIVDTVGKNNLIQLRRAVEKTLRPLDKHRLAQIDGLISNTKWSFFGGTSNKDAVVGETKVLTEVCHTINGTAKAVLFLEGVKKTVTITEEKAFVMNRRGKVLASIPFKQFSKFSLTPDTSKLAAVTKNSPYHITVFNTENLKALFHFKGYGMPITALGGDNDYLVAADQSTLIHLFSLKERKRKRSFQSLGPMWGTISAIGINRTNGEIETLQMDNKRTFIGYHWETGKMQSFQGSPRPTKKECTSMKWSHKAKWRAENQYWSNYILVWDNPTHYCFPPLSIIPEDGTLTEFEFSLDEQYLIAGTNKGMIYTWSLDPKNIDQFLFIISVQGVRPLLHSYFIRFQTAKKLPITAISFSRDMGSIVLGRKDEVCTMDIYPKEDLQAIQISKTRKIALEKLQEKESEQTRPESHEK